jgi:hypothetical protein
LPHTNPSLPQTPLPHGEGESVSCQLSECNRAKPKVSSRYRPGRPKVSSGLPTAACVWDMAGSGIWRWNRLGADIKV